MLKLTDFFAELLQGEHLALADAVGDGLDQVTHAAQCLTEQDSQHQDVAQFLAYLSTAIRQLEAARDLVRRRA